MNIRFVSSKINDQNINADNEDDSEYELNDNAEMSDSDETYSGTDDDQLVENVIKHD